MSPQEVAKLLGTLVLLGGAVVAVASQGHAAIAVALAVCAVALMMSEWWRRRSLLLANPLDYLSVDLRLTGCVDRTLSLICVVRNHNPEHSVRVDWGHLDAAAGVQGWAVNREHTDPLLAPNSKIVLRATLRVPEHRPEVASVRVSGSIKVDTAQAALPFQGLLLYSTDPEAYL